MTGRTTRFLSAASAAVCLLALAAGSTARAESSPLGGEGWHRVEHEAWIDLGRFVDCVTWRYVVRKDETLGEIAQRELGSATRVREILALNAGLEPKRLWVGDSVVMPPRSTGCQGKGPKWVFFAWSPDANGWAAPRQLVEGAIHRVSHGARLYAVPAARLQAVLGKATDHGLDGRVLEREPGVARSGIVKLVDALPDADPTCRIVTRWKVQDVVDGRITLARTSEARLDVSGGAVAVRERNSSRPSTFLLILAFGLILAVSGFGVARTQRLRAASEEEPDLEAALEEPVGLEVEADHDESAAVHDEDPYEAVEDEDEDEDDEPRV